MFARIENITKIDIPREDSLSNYDGLKIVREIVDYDSIENRYHPSLEWVEITSTDISTDQTYNPDTGEFGEKPSLPSLSISVSGSQIVNDGSDEVAVTITVTGVRSWDSDSWGGTLTIDGSDFSETFYANSETTETVTTTTKSTRNGIDIEASADGLQSATTKVEVVSA